MPAGHRNGWPSRPAKCLIRLIFFRLSLPAAGDRVRGVLKAFAAVLAGGYQAIDERLIFGSDYHALAAEVVFEVGRASAGRESLT